MVREVDHERLMEGIARWEQRKLESRTIYGLVDPRDRMVHYIGVTVDFPSRIAGHLSNRGNHGNNKPLRKWMAELDELGLKIIVRFFGVEPGVVSGCKKEAELIRQFYCAGHPLKNRKSVFHHGGKLVKEIQETLGMEYQI